MDRTPAPLNWQALSEKLKGSLHTDETHRILYSTDASVYRVLPDAVAVPYDEEDLRHIIHFAVEHQIPIISRTAGTSLAGQVVGKGLVVDFSVHFNQIIELNVEERWVKVQPGVIRDELNRYVQPFGLFFGPNTSTASRCMIGGMLGNNSAGTTSIKYGTTRDKIIDAEVLLSDGSSAVFGPKTADEVATLMKTEGLEGEIYRKLTELFLDPNLQKEIKVQYPDPGIHRRNTGYALDVILNQEYFGGDEGPLNLSKLLAGSEGTLCMVTSIKLALDALPPPFEAVVCAHFNSMRESLLATVIAMKHAPYACELMDKAILDCTKGNPEQSENRFFIEGDPASVVCIELRSNTALELEGSIKSLLSSFHESAYGYAFPVVYPPDSERVWNLRAAGLGVLSNVKGPAKPVAFVEDTAVKVTDLPDYIDELGSVFEKYGQKAVYYAHAGAGELHVRPVLNLKSKQGRSDFRNIAKDSALLVKKYRGALSGEHGDGRVRAEFIPLVLGAVVYDAMVKVKKTWDPKGIFNPGKITNALPMDTELRYSEGQPVFRFPTFLDFTDQGNIQEAAEACNGSGDCRKLHTTGATMCPSYQATRNEKDSTRARANMLREVLTKSNNPTYPLDSEPLMEVMDLCLSCKACRRECPSSVDMSMMKAEVSWQFGRRRGFSNRSRFFGHFHKMAALGSLLGPLLNRLIQFAPVNSYIKKRYEIAAQRSLPEFSQRKATSLIRNKMVIDDADFVFYIDEFTQYQDARIAEAASNLFKALGFKFYCIYSPSARAYISKGMLQEARETAVQTLATLSGAIEKGLPIVGLEPSAVLGFRDEYPKLVGQAHKGKADVLAGLAFTFEEYLSGQIDKGKINADHFDQEPREILVHLHCHQKSLSHVKYTKRVLSIPKNHQVKIIPSGCCGMAGSFGYEAEHYDLSMKIGELVLFPKIRATGEGAFIVAAGTSCRHQITDGTSRQALHPAELLLKCIKS